MDLKAISKLIFVMILVGCSLDLLAQSYQGLDAVKLYNAINGDSITIDSKSSGPLVVVIFTSNYCPYSRKYENRINELYQKFNSQNVQFLLVNPNEGPDDSIEEMKMKAESVNYQMPYLKDSEQLLTEILAATRTPEAFLLKPDENGFILVYQGALDDNPQTANDVEISYLNEAIESALNGEQVTPSSVRVTGCIIKK